MIKHTIVGIALFFCVVGTIFVICRHPTNTPAKENDIDVTVDRLDSLSQACESYQKLVGKWPPNRMSLLSVILISDENILIDAWGRDIAFVVYTNVPASMWLESYGADGLRNGVGMDADIVYRVP